MNVLSSLLYFIGEQIEDYRNAQSDVGTLKIANGSGKSIASGSTWVGMESDASLELEQGSWIVTGTINYSANANGCRGIRFYANNTSYTATSMQVPAVSGLLTRLSSTLVLNVTAEAGTTCCLQAIQDSGSTIVTTSYLRALRIK